MKSAYELAMERFGEPKEHSDAVKAELAEIESRHAAKRAEAKLAAQADITKAGADVLAHDEARANLARELARIDETCEAEKDAVRQRAGSESGD